MYAKLLIHFFRKDAYGKIFQAAAMLSFVSEELMIFFLAFDSSFIARARHWKKSHTNIPKQKFTTFLPFKYNGDNGEKLIIKKNYSFNYH